MEYKEFVIWLKGFAAGCEGAALSENKWSHIKDELSKLSDDKNGDDGLVIPDVNNILLTDEDPNPYFKISGGTSHTGHMAFYPSTTTRWFTSKVVSTI
jgi:hypothetical protein